jgi:hypothetical protein
MMLALVQYHSNCCGMASLNILVKLMLLLWDNVEAFMELTMHFTGLLSLHGNFVYLN